MRNKKLIAAGAGLAAMAAATGVAFAGGHGAAAGTSQAASSSATASRLDDGQDLLAQATISEQDAIAAAQRSARGALHEVDLERYQGHLVYNVDVGAKDVKVDATTGDVLAAPQDD